MSIGIIAGKGDLPILLASKVRDLGLEPSIAIIDGFGNILDFSEFNAEVFKMGLAGQILDFFKNVKVKNLVFAGKVERPSWFDLRVDEVGRVLLLRIVKNKVLGDDSVMNIISNFVAERGFTILAPDELLGSSQMSLNTNILPTQDDMLDIKLGIKIAKLLGQGDVGQAVVVEKGRILGVEGAEGTDALITRCKDLRSNSEPLAILVKVPKPMQSVKLDPPVIGPETIINLANSGFKGLALERVIVIDRPRVLSLANQFRLFIYECP
jgi:DUF1009 family protein